jgi:hypothetical protein
VQDDLVRYGPLALAMLAVTILVGKYPAYVGVPKERVRPTLNIFAGAFVLFVALDLVSGYALTSMTDLPRAALVLLVAVLVLLFANVIYLVVQRGRASR